MGKMIQIIGGFWDGLERTIMGAFIKSDYNYGMSWLPDSFEKFDYLTFTQIYQSCHGHDSYQTNTHKITQDGSCATASLNIDENPMVRWIEGFEVRCSREDLGKDRKASYGIFNEKRITIHEAVKLMEERTGGAKIMKIKKLKDQIEKLTLELRMEENEK